MGGEEKTEKGGREVESEGRDRGKMRGKEAGMRGCASHCPCRSVHRAQFKETRRRRRRKGRNEIKIERHGQ